MTKIVYIAGPLFSQSERQFLEEIVNILPSSCDLDPLEHFFLPHRDGGELGKGPNRSKIFALDINHLDKANIKTDIR